MDLVYQFTKFLLESPSGSICLPKFVGSRPQLGSVKKFGFLGFGTFWGLIYIPKYTPIYSLKNIPASVSALNPQPFSPSFPFSFQPFFPSCSFSFFSFPFSLISFTRLPLYLLSVRPLSFFLYSFSFPPFTLYLYPSSWRADLILILSSSYPYTLFGRPLGLIFLPFLPFILILSYSFFYLLLISFSLSSYFFQPFFLFLLPLLLLLFLLTLLLTLSSYSVFLLQRANLFFLCFTPSLFCPLLTPFPQRPFLSFSNFFLILFPYPFFQPFSLSSFYLSLSSISPSYYFSPTFPPGLLYILLILYSLHFYFKYLTLFLSQTFCNRFFYSWRADLLFTLPYIIFSVLLPLRGSFPGARQTRRRYACGVRGAPGFRATRDARRGLRPLPYIILYILYI